MKLLLDLTRSCCKNKNSPIVNVCALFNSATQDGRNMELYSNLLSDAIRSMVDLKEEKDLDSLFGSGETTALVNSIQGLDDFELLAFIVIQDEHQ